MIKKSKKGISGIVASVILIALVIASVTIVWKVVQGMISSKLKQSSSCFDIMDKVTLGAYTCFNSSGNEILFEIDVADINLDKVVVLVSGKGTTKSYTITNEEQELGLLSYPNREKSVKLPGENAGLTYIINDSAESPDLIKISPVINNNQCGVSDFITEIGSCSLI